VHVVHPRRQGREGLIGEMSTQGVVKTYDPTTGVGVVVLDDGTGEAYLRPGSLAGSIFRLLRQGQRIVFDVEDRDGTAFVTHVRVGQDGY
jgi:cold shock CspA family protein